MFIDAHTHLNDPKFSDRIAEVVSRMKEYGVDYIVNAGYDVESSVKAKQLSDKYPNMYYAVGIHPDDAKTLNGEKLNKLEELAECEKCVAIGEIGFDFYWNKSTREEQYVAFTKQVELANKLKLPVVIHSRDACGETLDFVKKNIKLLENGFLLHCFSYSAETAKEYIKLGAYFSFGGVITFKNAKKDEIIKTVSIDKVLSETDAPYLTPEPHRGETNEPAYVKFVVEKLAAVYGISTEETAKRIKVNAKKFFKKIGD